MDLASVSDDVLLGCIQKSANARTRKTYHSAFMSLAVALHVTGAVSALRALLSLEHVAAETLMGQFRDSLIAAGKKASSINTTISPIRSTVRRAHHLGLVNWILSISLLKCRPYANVVAIEAEDYAAVNALLTSAIASSATPNKKAIRDLAILRLAYLHSMGRKFIVELKREDLDLEAGTLLIPPHGEDLVVVPVKLCHESMEAISRYLEVRGNDPGPLFKNLDRAKQNANSVQGISGNAIYKMLKGYGVAIGKPLGIRKIRAGAIRQAAAQTNGDIRKVSAFARMKNLQAAQLYDTTDQELALGVAEGLGGT